jgi:hypothetical protein
MMALPNLVQDPLGLTSFTGAPVKEKRAIAPSSQVGFPNIEKPADPRPEIERRRGEIGTEAANIDVQIIDNLAKQGQFQAAQAKQKAESEAKSLRELDTSRNALEKSLYESPAYKSIQEKSKELAEKSTFNPDQQNAQTLAAVFSIIGAAGFLLGGNNKNTAKAALSAMNGMAEGYSKGRDQYAKEQRLAFETNQKALRGTLDSLEKAFTYELEQNKNDLESATRNAKIAALERDASFINANIDKYGLVSTLEQLRSNKKQLETVLGALQKKEDAYAAETQKEWFANESKKATAAAAQERVRYQEQERTAREQERRQDQERRDIERREDTQRFQREMAQFRVENRPVPKEPRSAVEKAREEREIRTLVQGVRGIENLQDQLRKPEVRTGLVAKAAPLLERLKSLAPGADFETAVNQTLTGTDETTLFLKDALLETYAIESAAKGGQRLTVQDMKMVGPVLDPTNYTPQTYNALLDQRRKVLYDNLQDRGLTPDEIKKASARRPYTPYGGEAPSPAAQPSAKKDEYVVGMEYKDGKGGKAVYLGDGKWKER